MVGKLVYRFEEGDATQSELLGGKGSNLCEMAHLGLPVPPGFVITTQVCQSYFSSGQTLPEGLWESLRENIDLLESSLAREFGSSSNPLLVSVRSGAAVSMPGMMDTILNLGINDEIAEGLAGLMDNPRAAYDAYRRFLQIYAGVVLEVPNDVFEPILGDAKTRAQVSQDHQLSPEQLRAIIEDYKEAIRRHSGRDVPEDPWTQLKEAVEAVFRSWNTPRAIHYRDYYGISQDLGTAVTIMSMVYGNLGDTSGTGVLFTRDPSSGKKEVLGEYLPNAQGEDVVAGGRTPRPLAELATSMPQVYRQLTAMAHQLENHYRDLQDIEFTVEEGRLFLLQTRNAKRTPMAAVRAAVDMAEEGLITRQEALLRIKPDELSQLLVPKFTEDLDSAEAQNSLLARGAPASPGAASGMVCFDAAAAVAAALQGEAVILVRPETKPDDIHGITASVGVLTCRGGVTSHAAVVTRGMGIPCVVSCEEVWVDLEQGCLTANGKTVWAGEYISLDGGTGEVFHAAYKTELPELDEFEEGKTLLGWADRVKRLGVWANADTPQDATQALSLGAEGIGLCRTEHMFLDPERLPAVRQMLLNAPAAEEWRRDNLGAGVAPKDQDQLGELVRKSPVRKFYEALDQVRRFQTEDFTGILRVMGNRPVIIRLLDAPLHEFLPSQEELLAELEELRSKPGVSSGQITEKEELARLADSLREANPMLGHRGCRLGLSFPPIYQMQVEAIMTASVGLIKQGCPVQPEIMIPLIVDVEEMRRLRRDLTAVAEAVQQEAGVRVAYKFGTMIETPRAALTAGKIAEVADFFSFGTNDLTQLTFGFSRDDAEGKFLRSYIQEGILPADPFSTLDQEGVGDLIRHAVAAGREARPSLELGICGEHGGDGASVAFFHRLGLDYVSCSPYRVPAARLAAAQAALAESTETAD
ncbi:MAG: pyruvate, phosphate dikinase [Chloroflexi bacterium]|nr:pyruvate, phosphate dikinase [Chloroflexota bacterium]